MGQPAARVGDFHMCPMVTPGTPPIPHVGGPILPPGAVTVMIGGMPAATATNTCLCTGPPDTIAKGSMGVMIGGLPAARMGDLTAHGGTIMIGCPTVMIGDVGMGAMAAAVAVLPIAVILDIITKLGPEAGGALNQTVTMVQAAIDALPFVEICPA